jgi:hypothetical protein
MNDFELGLLIFIGLGGLLILIVEAYIQYGG